MGIPSSLLGRGPDPALPFLRSTPLPLSEGELKGVPRSETQGGIHPRDAASLNPLDFSLVHQGRGAREAIFAEMPKPPN